MSKQWEVYLISTLAVVGTDPESADYDNPRGEVYADIINLQAEHIDGRRYLGPSLGQGEAKDFEAEADKFRANLPSNWTPENQEGWSETYPAYGSNAYLATEAEQAYSDDESESGSAPFVGY